jgi:hypothetical protein
VQQVNGEALVKWVETSPATPNLGGSMGRATTGVLANVSHSGVGGGSNLQQPFYQTMAYCPGMVPMGSGVPHGPIPNVMFPRMSSPNTLVMGFDGGRAAVDGVRDQIARTLREFGLMPKGWARAYQKPYLEYYDTIPYPRGFRVLISRSSPTMMPRPHMST